MASRSLKSATFDFEIASNEMNSGTNRIKVTIIDYPTSGGQHYTAQYQRVVTADKNRRIRLASVTQSDPW